MGLHVTIDALVFWTAKGVILVLAGAVFTRALRNAPAAVRHTVWTVVVTAHFVLPFAGMFVPREVLDVRIPSVKTAPAVMPEAIAPVFRSQEGNPASSVDPERVAVAAAGAVALLLLMRLAAGTLRVLRIAHRSRRVMEAEWVALIQSCRTSVRVSRQGTVLWSDDLSLPVTWGFVRPVILLPVTGRSWTPAQRRHVLIHELAHIRRRDALTQLMAQCALALFWFHPLLWLAVRQMRAEAENAADDYVLREGERPSEYARTLVALVRAHQRSSPPPFASLAVARRSEIEQRVRAITHPRRTTGRRRLLSACAVGMMLLIVLPLSAVSRATAREGVRLSRTDGAPPKNSACRPLHVPAAEFRESSGRLTLDGVTTHYFFLQPASDRCIEASFSLDARFTDDDRDIVADEGASSLVRERIGSLDRAVYTNVAGGRRLRRFVVNGAPADWDGAAEDWYRGLMPEVVRTTSAGVLPRAKRIVQREGAAGLIAELDRIGELSIRRQYLEALLTLRSEGELPRERVVEVARERFGEDEPTLARFLATLMQREGASREVRLTVLDAARELRSPLDRTTVLEAMTSHPNATVRFEALRVLPITPGGRSSSERALAQPR